MAIIKANSFVVVVVPDNNSLLQLQISVGAENRYHVLPETEGNTYRQSCAKSVLNNTTINLPIGVNKRSKHALLKPYLNTYDMILISFPTAQLPVAVSDKTL